MSRVFQGFPVITQTGVVVTTSGSSQTATLPLTSSGKVPAYIRIATTAACCWRLFPAAGGSAALTDTQITPGGDNIFGVPDGMTKISVIQTAATGAFQVSPLENS